MAGRFFRYSIVMLRLILAGAVMIWSYVSFIEHPTADAPLTNFSPENNSPMSQSVSPLTTPSVSAKAYGVFDVMSGEVLFGEQLDKKMPLASVAKLFTASAVLRHSDPTTPVVITAYDVATEGEAGGLKVGDVFTLRELLFPLLLVSSNDSATAIERTIGPVPFINSTLVDASGLSDSDQASVNELAVAVSALYRDEPHLFDITRLSKYLGEYGGWTNNSPVRELSGYIGGKHGFTTEAGRTLVALFRETELDGRIVGYVILGSNDLMSDTEALRATLTDSVTRNR